MEFSGEKLFKLAYRIVRDGRKIEEISTDLI
jgi:hypothetical protein